MINRITDLDKEFQKLTLLERQVYRERLYLFSYVAKLESAELGQECVDMILKTNEPKLQFIEGLRKVYTFLNGPVQYVLDGSGDYDIPWSKLMEARKHAIEMAKLDLDIIWSLK